MSTTKDICIVCAWRADCQKRFSVKSKDFRCPDFVRDITLPEEKEETEKTKQSESKRQKG